MKYDVIVCGGGVVGLWTANHLAEQKKNVLLIEQFSFPHSRGSSHGPSRITRYSYITSHHCKMMSDAFEMWSKLEESLKTQLFVNCGLLSIFSENTRAALTKSLDEINLEYENLTGREIALKFSGIADIGLPGVLEKTGGVLKANQCLELLQIVGQRFSTGGLRTREGGHWLSLFKGVAAVFYLMFFIFYPPKREWKGVTDYMKILKKKNLLRLGGSMRDGEKVELIKPINDELVEVVTNKETYLSGSVVLTCGSWINNVLKPLNLQLPVKVYRVSVEYWPAEDPAVYDVCNFPAIILYDSNLDMHIYSTPVLEYPGLMKVCLGKSVEVDPDEPDRYDKKKTDEHTEQLKSIISYCFPKLTPNSAVQETCLLTKTPDEDFILDYHPQYKNIIIGAGMSGHGFKISPVVGKILADLAIGKSPKHDLKPFLLCRFS